jgi:predicted metal-binding membrane protein
MNKSREGRLKTRPRCSAVHSGLVQSCHAGSLAPEERTFSGTTAAENGDSIMSHTIFLADNLESRISRSMRTSHRAFIAVSALLFAISAALTILCCASMPAMRGMPMPGGWTMSMVWMPVPGDTEIEATVSFLAMWVVMMMAMMLPSLVPMLWRYRQAVGWRGESHLGSLTVLAGLGYFFVWTLFGLALFPLGTAMAACEMELPALARAVPVAVAVVVLIAGGLQFHQWKAYHLACCREAPGRGRTLPADIGTAWRQGLHFGLHCGMSCANLTAILLVIGVMDPRAMALVTAAITVERLAPAGERVAQVIGAVVVGAGLVLLARAAGLA